MKGGCENGEASRVARGKNGSREAKIGENGKNEPRARSYRAALDLWGPPMNPTLGKSKVWSTCGHNVSRAPSSQKPPVSERDTWKTSYHMNFMLSSKIVCRKERKTPKTPRRRDSPQV